MELALIVTTVVSVVLAAGMGIVAWRLDRAERRRSAARVAALAADLGDVERVGQQMTVGMRTEPMRIHHVARRSIDFDNLELRSGPASVPAGEMFLAGASDRSSSRLAAVLAVGSFAVAAALALVIATSRGEPSIAEPMAVQALTPAPPADASPLELVALIGDREGEQITIRGVVRNPVEGASVDQLTAVVNLFDREGGLLGTGANAIDVPALAPGAESRFVVVVGQAGDIGPYRVSFKTGDHVVPHVDRRRPDSTVRTAR